MKWPALARTSSNRRIRLLVAAGLLAVAGGGWACIGYVMDSVHFNGDSPDFGAAPPPIVLTVWGEERNRPGATQDGKDDYQGDGEGEYQKLKDLSDKRSILRAQGWNEVEKGDYNAALTTFAQLLKTGHAEDNESIVDTQEVLRQAKSPSNPVTEYLEARKLLSNNDAADSDKKKPADTARARAIFRKLSKESGFLKAHALYALAGMDYDDRRIPAATAGYRIAAAAGGPRRERALIMEARCLLQYGTVADGQNWDQAAAPSATDLAAAETVLATLGKEFPVGHFAGDAEGLRARVQFLGKKYPAAMVFYLHRLAGTKAPEAQAGVLASLKATSKRLSAADAKDVQAAITKDPSLLQPYLDYRLYHTSAKSDDYKGLLAFAGRVLAANPNTQLSASIYARMAEISWILHDRNVAGEYSARSLGAPSGTNDRRDLAYYIRGGVLAGGASNESAIAAYQGVLKTPSSYLAPEARENLALLYEQSGQWNDALKEYQTLSYTYDFAYLLDVRMTPAEIQAVIDARGAKDSKHDQLVFSLAMRYLRADQLEKARDLFASIPQASRDALSHKGSRDYAAAYDAGSTFDTLYDPLDTANDLIGLRKAVTDASGDDAKAKTLYDLASYYYTRRNLLLYNASLWEGARNFTMTAWNEKVATRDDREAFEHHQYEHEALYHARSICLAVAKEYPKTSYAPKALYRAGTASRRLANFNGWWREHNKAQDLYEDAAKLLDRVVAEYPQDALAPNARKYAVVFRKEGKGEEENQLFPRSTREPRE